MKDVPEIAGATWGQKFLYSNAFFGWKIDLHMSGLTSKTLKNFCPWSAQDIVNSMDLVELILTGEKRFFGYQFEENTAKTPNVHFLVIVAVCHEALGSPVPTSGYVVGVGGGGVFAFAGAEIGQFDEISLDENIFRFDIPVEDTFAVHKLDSSEDLEHVELYFLEGERVFFILEAFVQIHIHEFED